MLHSILIVLGMAMLPIIELRGALPVGLALDLPIPVAFSAAVLGNMIPVPFIILFIHRVFQFLSQHVAFMQKVLERIQQRAMNKREVVDKYELWGLFLLVAIPLPGTGAWMGALIAALLDIRIKRAILPIFLGVCVAGILVLLASLGVIGLFF